MSVPLGLTIMTLFERGKHLMNALHSVAAKLQGEAEERLDQAFELVESLPDHSQA